MKIKEGTREGNLLKPIRVGATGVEEAGAVGISMPIAALGSSRMSVAVKNDMQSNQRVVSGIFQEENKKKNFQEQKTHTYSLGFLLTAIIILIGLRNCRHHDKLILGILKDLLKSLIRRQVSIRPSSGRARNG